MNTSVGRMAESYVEEWLTSQGWTCFERNMRVPGGEIDRLFVRERGRSGFRVDLCVAEVKATLLNKKYDAQFLFSASKMRSLMRPGQLRVLWRSAARYETQLKELTHAPVRTYVRYFLVVYGQRKLLSQLCAELKASASDAPIRVCKVSSSGLILAWSPEVSPQPY